MNKKDKKTTASDQQREEQKRTQIAKKKMIEAMVSSFGLVIRACRLSGVSRTQHYKWMNTDAEYKSEIEAVDYKELKADFAEDMLLQKIETGDTACILFTMKCLGKSRGYIEKEVVTQDTDLLQYEVGHE